ncbi:MAG: hypothetical protein HUJ71_00615 [Pseudobutyrivibrio sp.]|nr:hypothetical protein [Pseudobutyrivibrio sp.]
MRFRIEIDLNEFDEQMKRVDDALIQYPFEVTDDKYCEVRYMNLKDDFLILDVYIETKQTDQIDNGYNEAYT